MKNYNHNINNRDGLVVTGNNSKIINGNDNSTNVSGDNISSNINGINTGIIIGKINIYTPQDEKQEIDYLIKRGKLSLNFKLVHNVSKSISLFSLVGFIASIITIFQSFSNGMNNLVDKLSINASWFLVFSVILVLSMYVSVTLSELKRKKLLSFFTDYIFGFDVGLYKDGRIAKLKLTSDCQMPNCGGKLNFSYDKKQKKYYFVCSRNSSQHKFEFDFTSIDY